MYNTKYTVHPCQNKLKDVFLRQKIKTDKNLPKGAHKGKKDIVDQRWFFMAQLHFPNFQFSVKVSCVMSEV